MSAQIFFMPNKMEKGLIDHFQSDVTAKVFGYLHNYFTMMGGSFYKFKEPCDHPLYREGDSWKETLKMTKRVFNPEFDKLVNYHKSKKAFKECSDPFGGKLFCSYFERTTKTTYYIENKGLVEQLINSIKEKLASSPPRTASKSKEVDVVILQPKNTPIVSPTGEQIVSPNVLLRNTLQAITSFAEPPSKPPVDKSEEEKIKLSVKEMVNTWNSQLNDQVILWPSMVSKLHEILQTYFGGDLEKFKKYCETVASNKFFAGKSSSTYKLFLFQAIKPEFLQTILNSCGVKSAITIPLSDEKELDRSIDNLANQLQVIEQKKSSILSEYKANQKKKTGEKITSLSPEQLAADRKIFEHEYFEKNPNKTDLGDGKFSRMVLDLHFDGKDGFLYRKYGLEFSQEIVYPPHLLAEEKSIINAITLKKNELNSLKGVNVSKKYAPQEAPRKAWEPEPTKHQERGLRSFGQLFSFG